MDNPGDKMNPADGTTPTGDYRSPIDSQTHNPDTVDAQDGDVQGGDHLEHEDANSEHEKNPEVETQKTHQMIARLVQSVPKEYLWGVVEDKRLGQSAQRRTNPDLARIRFYSLPSSQDPATGVLKGELFMSVGFIRSKLDEGKLNDPYAVMVTEQHGSGNPWGDVLGSLEAGAIVKKYTIEDTYFLAEDRAVTRSGNFTYGPARLEAKQNAEQANNPTSPTTVEHLQLIRDRLAQAIIQSPTGDTITVAELLGLDS